MHSSVHVSNSNDQVTIHVAGHFGFPLYREFRDAYTDKPPGMRYVIDMSDTDYLDSSALGMLLVLREHAGNDRSEIELAHCKPEVRKILEIAHFDRLFRIT